MTDKTNKWKKKLELGWFDGPILSLNKYLIEFQGKKYDKWLVSGYSIGFKIRDWKIEAYHAYYDGNNCAWQFGPFTVTRFGHTGECKGCNDS